MGKVDANKQQKLKALFQSAYELFLGRGIEKTSIHDIVEKAGVAKGTFYLYFKDKYDIRDRLIAKTAAKLFTDAQDALMKENLTSLEDKIVFIVDYVLDEMQKNKAVLKFISKNLSWGIFRHAIETKSPGSEIDVKQMFYQTLEETPEVRLREPETMLFLIVELASSTSFSTILEEDPMSFAELKPYLYDSIRAIVRNHIIE